MAKIHAFIKTDYLDKNGKAPVLIEYFHLRKRWRVNTKVRVDPGTFSCHYDESEYEPRKSKWDEVYATLFKGAEAVPP